MSDARQVKVDNWGIYFLQRLKHFFNRTDYCDLTLQFQDNAQLKVHRLVLSACTEYFELLERTCEMYEDCLVMPDDLQADVVVPIINFMYTGQLEFKQDLLEKLYQTSLIMNLPILTKLLDAHRPQQKHPPAKPAFSSNSYYGKRYSKPGKAMPVAGSSGSKRSFSSAFENTEFQTELHKMKKPSIELFSKAECIVKNGNTPSYQFPIFSDKNKSTMKDPRPTRYELPEELDEEHLFDNSFSRISYGSKPLMIHPETSTKQYSSKRINLFEEGTSSSRFMRVTPNDVVECRKISSHENIFLDSLSDSIQDDSIGSFQSTSQHIKEETKDNSQLFDQILENKPSKITIETKNNTQAQNLDHAKIISEVLKKYPHLVKNNKNIKLKILNTTKTKKPNMANEEKQKSKFETSTEEKTKPVYNKTQDFTYQSDVINSKEAAKLIALGADNIAGPWICLICGTPGKALHFTSYFNFRKHLVEVHNEKAIPTMCEYCGVKSQKRNYLVHHKLTKHGVTPPPAYTFPKCNHCDYVALNEALLVKHKSNHNVYKCLKYNMPSTAANTAQKNTRKYLNQSPDKKINNLQCLFCLRTFQRIHNLYAHLKINHKEAAKNEGLIDDSEDEQEEEKFSSNLKINNTEASDNIVKVEVPVTFENTYEDDEQYQIEQKPDGSICVSTKKPRVLLPTAKNKILNLGFGSPQQSVSSVTHAQKAEPMHNTPIRNEIPQNTYQSNPRSTSSQETVVIDNEEYILQNNHLIPKKEKSAPEYVLHTPNDAELQTIIPTTSMEYNIPNSNPERKMFIKKSTHLNQPYQIVVSSEEEYKALINSNQSLLYEEGQTNQALCELEGPDNSSLATGAIDLDNTQPNDMMIIPDYHMNVPVTVADNSNIVVVYSHPLEDQNKQYSIITTQGEFVQSSAILTQNYETVTTCPPVVTPHTTIESSWQNNINATINKLPIPSTADLQTGVVGETLTIEPIESIQTNSLNELTEVHLTTSEPVTLEVAQTEPCMNSFDESNIITTNSQQCINPPVCQPNDVVAIADPIVLANIQQQVQIQSLPSTNLDQITSISSFSQASAVDNSQEQNTIAHEVASNYHEQSSVNTLEQQTTLTHEMATNYREVEPIVGEILYQNNGMSSTQIAAESNETCESVLDDAGTQVNNIHESVQNNQQLGDTVKETLVDDEETIENIARDIDESGNAFNKRKQSIDQTQKETTLTTISNEQIQNLTSEWSEDETEITLAEQSNVSNTNLENIENDNTSELGEESIENIQKEVNKQVSGQPVDSMEDNNIPNDTVSTKDNEHISVNSQEKITSLLNDWDENDSQEEIKVAAAESDNQQSSNIQENISTVDINNVATIETVDTSEINKNDNIKKLVSDWDEDDEEENKD